MTHLAFAHLQAAAIFFLPRTKILIWRNCVHCFPLHSMLAEKLNMTPEEAERWIVNLIRNAKLDAKIDSKLVKKPIFELDYH